MTRAMAIDWFRELLWQVVLIAAPPIGAIVAVGLLVAILQATTSVNDQAVAFGPKGLAGVVALSIGGPFILNQLVEFATSAFTAVARIGP